MPCEVFLDHVATDDSLSGVAGMWSACGLSVVELDHDEEMELMHGMHGTSDADLEVQRTIKKATLTAFLCLLRGIVGTKSNSVVERCRRKQG